MIQKKKIKKSIFLKGFCETGIDSVGITRIFSKTNQTETTQISENCKSFCGVVNFSHNFSKLSETPDSNISNAEREKQSSID